MKIKQMPCQGVLSTTFDLTFWNGIMEKNVGVHRKRRTSLPQNCPFLKTPIRLTSPHFPKTALFENFNAADMTSLPFCWGS
eukprot:g8208.t1